MPPGPVASPAAASAMARTVRRLLGADLAVAATGAGGPEPADGSEPGTVFLALDADGAHRVLRLLLDGDDMQAVLATAAATALQMLVDGLESATPPS